MGTLTQAEIRTGLEKVNTYLAARGVKGEVCLYGGACLCLAFAARMGGIDEEDFTDLRDALWLCHRLGVGTREEIAGWVLKYFPDRELPERTGFFVDELLSRLEARP